MSGHRTWEAVLLDKRVAVRVAIDRTRGARDDGDTAPHSYRSREQMQPKMTSLRTESARLGLVAEAIDDLRGGTDESNTSLLNFTREFGILGEEAIARSS